MTATQRLSTALVLAAVLSTTFGLLRFAPPAGLADLAALRHILDPSGASATRVTGGAPQPLAVGPAAVAPAAPGAAGPATRTDHLVEALQLRVRERPSDQRAYAQLGAAYLQKARETGDPAYYGRAEAALGNALELQPGDGEAMAAMGTLALARHQFEVALDWGARSLAQQPNRAAAYGVLGDALIELGRYDDTIRAFQRMIDIRPDLASYARVSYARELFGDLEGALEAMQLAAQAGAAETEGAAWARVHLGHLHFALGDLPAARASYEHALRVYPGYVPAQAALARLEAAAGDYRSAIALLAPVVETQPLPEYAILLGDVYRAVGDTPAAAQQDNLVRAIARLQRANGVDLDVEMALFEADHADDADDADHATGAASLAAAVELARGHYARRPSIHGADVLAWTLYRAGQPEPALAYAREALRLGTHDPLLLFHAGAIAAGAGEPAEARDYLERAVQHNPRFSVRYAPEAARLLEALAIKP